MSGRTVRIGLTGPIGCGKSTVASWLGESGAEIIDADEVAREVTRLGMPAVAAIAAAFGGEVLLDDGSLDRHRLGQVVFADPEALRRLERIVHPAVRPVILERMDAAAERGAPAVVIEAIKLVEGGLAELCDEIWLVRCEPAEQLTRLLARGAREADAAARIEAQSGIVERLSPAASRIIDTSGPVADARSRVELAWHEAVG